MQRLQFTIRLFFKIVIGALIIVILIYIFLVGRLHEIAFVKWIFNLCNEYNIAVTVIATSALVIITAIYVAFTFKLCKETERGRKDAFLPVVSVDFSKGGIVIKNTGKGLAQKIVVESDPSGVIHLPKNISPGFELAISSSLTRVNKGYIKFIYEDIFSRKCMTEVWLGNEEYKFIPPRK